MPDLITTMPIDAALHWYQTVRLGTEALAAPLSAEDQTVQSMADASPTKWHRAHTSWFFETFLLEPKLPGYQVFHPAFGFLFNSYYEQVGARFPRPQRGVIGRPGISEVAAYRRHVDDAMTELMDVLGGSDLDRGSVLQLVELGLHHEQQHQELVLMDIKHALSCNPILPPYLAASDPGIADPRPGSGGAEVPVGPGGGEAPKVAGAPSSGSAGWRHFDGGLGSIGHDGHGFGFDNEFPRHQVALSPFALASRPVTCGDWVQFVEDGGYHRPELWLSDGWASVMASGWSAPLYWLPADGRWDVFTLAGPRPLDMAEPVCHVSYYEADAFARWAGARLPTEAEWEVAASAEALLAAAAPQGSQGVFGPGSVVPALHPRPVGADAPLMGDVWQWTQSAYSPYPGYRQPAGAVGEYNGKFMVNQYVLRGGSCLTPLGHARPSYRNFFPASARWPVTGVRLAADR